VTTSSVFMESPLIGAEAITAERRVSSTDHPGF